ncbi:Fructose-bisphosphate aldolase C [Tetrabaena socialis]|uniref:fructose-bisphosphate aldolase n=1 Tax=Tetrabaena socialis TaxID=47790 RepID=A0A2J8A577_9CHLO|nr:Fructose-bisphosphate aldolase C [Tetrabaena socialis]|eukprot:PNH07692.1 Fructose-bisphosphate aldolase C [Tetrabaena socialis]
MSKRRAAGAAPADPAAAAASGDAGAGPSSPANAAAAASAPNRRRAATAAAPSRATSSIAIGTILALAAVIAAFWVSHQDYENLCRPEYGDDCGKGGKAGKVDPNLELRAVAARLLHADKGILAADESPDTFGRRVANATLRVLLRTVPRVVPGVVFLSGGQSEEAATANMLALGRAAKERVASGKPPLPWAISFSFGRALQSSGLDLWQAGDAVAAAQAVVVRARANALAQKGEAEGSEEKGEGKAKRKRKAKLEAA